MKLNKIINNEIFQLILLIISAAFIIYFMPLAIKRLVFLFLLPAVWSSKKDYFWLAFFFVISESPGGLFGGGIGNDEYRLPLYQLGGGIAFSITELFYILILIKVIVKRKIIGYAPNFFKRELQLIVILFIVLIIISLGYGISYQNYKYIYKTIVNLSLFYSFYRLINSKEKLLNFIGLLLPFSFLAVILQAYYLINGYQLVAILKPGMSLENEVAMIYSTGFWVRPLELENIMCIVFTGSLFLISYKKHNFNKNYLVVTSLASFLVILMGATRSYVVAFFVVYILFFFFTGSKRKEIFRFALVIFFAGYLILSLLPAIEKQISNAWNRISTIGYIAEGDITAGGTMLRYDVRAPSVMKGFDGSTIIFGAGFSDYYNNWADMHVGYHNLLLNTGIVGCFIFFIFILKLLTFPFNKKVVEITKNPPWLKTTIFPLIVLLVFNSASQAIGFTLAEATKYPLMPYAFVLINLSILLARDKNITFRKGYITSNRKN